MAKKLVITLLILVVVLLISGGVTLGINAALPQIPQYANFPIWIAVSIVIFLIFERVIGVSASLVQIFDYAEKKLTGSKNGERILPRLTITGTFPHSELDRKIEGRDDSLKAVLQSFKNGTRITVIHGFGGMGKTRLAAEVVAKSRFKDGVIWFRVEAENKLENLTLLIRDHLALDVTAQPDIIWGALGQKAVLLVVDNAESCTERKTYADRLNSIDTRNGARVLFTSRDLWPELNNVFAIEAHPLDPAAAVRALKGMVEKQPPTYRPDGREAEFAKAARYHPGLMRYALGWLYARPLNEVLAALDTLEGAGPDEALDNFVQRTVDLMAAQPNGAEALAGLCRLAVCRGGFTHDAAKAILGDIDPQILNILLRWKMVSLEKSDAGDRFNIDPLVATVVDEDPAAHRPHYDYYKTLAREHDKKQDYLGLDPESANLEAAFEWSTLHAPAHDVLRLYSSCVFFLENRGRFEQIKKWLESSQIAAEKKQPDLYPYVQQLVGMAYASFPTGNRRDNLQKAIDGYQIALGYFKTQSMEENIAEVNNNLGIVYADLAAIEDRAGNLHRAIECYQSALEYRTPFAAPLDYAMTQNNLGTAYRALSEIEDRVGNLQRAIAAYEATLIYWTPETAPLYYAITQNNLGAAYRELGTGDRADNLQRAVAAYQAALIYRTPSAAPLDYAMTQRNLGITYEDLGDLPAAIACWREAEIYYRQMDAIENADLMLRWIANAEAKLKG